MSLSLAEHLGPKTEIWKAHRELVEELTGIKKGAVDDREDYCSQKVETAFGFASGRLVDRINTLTQCMPFSRSARFFVQEVFNEDSRLKATRIITGDQLLFDPCCPLYIETCRPRHRGRIQEITLQS